MPDTPMEPMANIALRAARLAAQHIVHAFDRPDLVKLSTKGHNDFVKENNREDEMLTKADLFKDISDKVIKQYNEFIEIDEDIRQELQTPYLRYEY